MNNLFEVANIYLHYRGGKHVGLAGLVGVLVAIFIAIIWSDWIQPVINFVGLNKVAEDMGIVVDGVGGTAVTAYNVLILYLFFCLAFSLFLGIGLLVFVYGSTAMTTKVGATVFGIIVFIIFSPILIWFTISKVLEGNKENKKALENPEIYREKQRLQKNENLFDHLIYTTEKNGKTNKIRKIDAVRFLHRVPASDENTFLIGITYNREPVLLFPRPFGTVVYGTVHRLIGVSLRFEEFIPMKHDPRGMNWETNPERFYMITDKELKQWNINEIETFIYPKRVHDAQRILKDYDKDKFYLNYVKKVQEHYQMNKNKHIELNDKEKEIVSVVSPI